ncbi:hypothetical protein QBZ16_002078 [Prototheca wickerhamii]|uniref:Nuclear pore protein n=1 Tax=Prototheca wickerhamii TaxID=3111 RepID=A0AAD9MMH6_PROWI|nr:hypothetical protein QBZ16_002078 [Prototheca wickerhamii]
MRIERDLTQVERYAQRLLTKSSRTGLGTSFDADRLLASEGVDPVMLRKMVQLYELRSRPQDVVVAASAGGVGEYVEQTQQALTVTSLRRSGLRAGRSFDRFLEASLDARWAADREALFDRAAAPGLPALPLGTVDGGDSIVAAPAGALSGAPALSARAAAYAAVARRMERVASNARAFLEREFVEHMRVAVRAQRGAAALGAAPSRQALVHAYLRVRLAPSARRRGEDTTWVRVWACLRAGFLDEAVAALQGSVHARAPGDARGEAPALAALRAAAAAARAARRRRRAAGAFAGQRLAVHAFLARSGAAADALSAAFAQALPTIEDWLWLRLGLLGGEDCRLADVQAAVTRCPASHYTHGGREPLRFVRVLLLAQLWEESVAYLARDAGARPWRLEAVYLSAALVRAGATSGAAREGADPACAAPQILHRYARELLPLDLQAALDHYALAAEAAGGSARAGAACCASCCWRAAPFASCWARAARARRPRPWQSSSRTRASARVLEAVAADCAVAGRSDEAVELYAFAGAATPRSTCSARAWPARRGPAPGGLHPALLAALPALVLAAARALAGAGRRQALAALTSYASELAPRFSQVDFKELSALNARLG